ENAQFDVLFTENQQKGLGSSKFNINDTIHVIRTDVDKTSARGGSITLIPKVSNPIQIFNREMSSHSNVILYKRGVSDGDTFTISRIDSSEINVAIQLDDEYRK